MNERQSLDSSVAGICDEAAVSTQIHELNRADITLKWNALNQRPQLTLSTATVVENLFLRPQEQDALNSWAVSGNFDPALYPTMGYCLNRLIQPFAIHTFTEFEPFPELDNPEVVKKSVVPQINNSPKFYESTSETDDRWWEESVEGGGMTFAQIDAQYTHKGVPDAWEAIQLSRAWQIDGQTWARDELIMRNIRFIMKQVSRYRGKLVQKSDLFQEAIVGMMKAANEWKAEYGYVFATFAQWQVQLHVKRLLGKMDHPISVTSNVEGELIRLQIELNNMRSNPDFNQGDISEQVWFDSIREKLGWSEKKFARRMSNLEMLQKVELDAPVSDENDSSVMDSIADERLDSVEDTAVNNDRDAWMHLLLERLEKSHPRHALVLRMRYGIGTGEELTRIKVGKILSISNERVRQIEERAMNIISHWHEEERRNNFLGRS